MHETIRGDEELFANFCRKEEYGSPIVDQYGRFPYYASKNRNIFEPVVSRHLVQNGFRAEYEDGAKFAVCLSHDVDALNQQGVLSFSARFLKATLGGGFSNAFSTYGAGTRRGRFLDFEEIMALEEAHGARSSFYFLAVDPASEDFAYDVNELKGEMGSIIDKGWEVGLHGSQRAHADLSSIVEEKQRLESALGRGVVGYRNHYLRFRTPGTWRLLHQAGFLYDTTLGYADCAGFRNGMCHPFRPFDIETGSRIEIVEIPLVLMDQTLFGDYMRLDQKAAWELIKALIDRVEECHGVMSILWHNYLMFDEYQRLYGKILRYCEERKAWMTSGEELVKNAISHGL